MVREIAADGDETVVAGAGGSTLQAGQSFAVPATSADLPLDPDGASGITTDTSGNLLIATTGRQVEVVAQANGAFYGVAMTKGDIYQLPISGSGVAVDSAGNVVTADNTTVRSWPRRPGPSTGRP